MCDEIIETTKPVPTKSIQTNFNEKKKLSVERKVSVFCFCIFINWKVVNKKKLILKIAYVIILMT